MKNGPLFLLGLFAALAISFGGIVLGSHAQLGGLTGYFDDSEGQSYPQRPAGLAARGQQVYADLGCAACHTQQVRRPGFGSDQARGWGDRQSVARDYIHQARPQLGASRLGPDLANLAVRKPAPPTDADLYGRLITGSAHHPAYAFLFETRRVEGERSLHGVKPAGVTVAPGDEIVPTERARTLVAYLLSLNTGYEYPESRPVASPAGTPDHSGSAAHEPKKAGDEKK